MTNAEMAGREGGGDSFQGILLSSFGVCTSHFFFPFQTSIIAFFTKTQTSQKFWDKSLSFPLFTQSICRLLRNVHYSHSFVQIDFHLFYFIYSRLTLHHHSSQNHFIFA